MRSQLIFFLALAMFIALIFGVTVISQYAGDDTTLTPPTDAAAGPVILGSPLLFSTTEGIYRPDDESITKRYFNAYHEVSSQEVRIPFWFKNPYPVPVAVSVRGRSCTSCTAANLGVISADAMKRYILMNAMSSLPASPLLGVHPLGVMQLAMLLETDIERKMLDFEKPDQFLLVPAAADERNPTYGVFEMMIRVSGLGPKSVSALLTMQTEGRAAVPQEFRVSLAGMPPFDVEPRKIELGELRDGASSRTFDIFVFSATRDSANSPSLVIN